MNANEVLICFAIFVKSITKSVERFRFCLKFALCHMAMRINENELGSIWLIAFKSVQFSSAYIGLAHFKSA